MPDENSAAEVDPLDQLAAEEAAAEAAAPQGATAQVNGQQQLPGQEPASDEQQAQQEPEWRSRFETEEEMYERLRNVEVNDGRQRNELGDLRAQVALREQQLQQLVGTQQGQPAPGQQQGLEGIPQLSDEDLMDWYDQDPISATRYLAASAAAEVAALQQQQLQPVFASVHDAQASQSVERLKAEFGDDMVHRNREALAAAVAADRDYFAEPKTRDARLRQTLLASEFEAQRSGRSQQAQQQARTAENGQFAPAGGDQRTVHMEGGSTPAPSGGQGDLDPIIAEIEAAGVREDAYGAIPVHQIPG
jgi:hypothetical protein